MINDEYPFRSEELTKQINNLMSKVKYFVIPTQDNQHLKSNTPYAIIAEVSNSKMASGVAIIVEDDKGDIQVLDSGYFVCQ